jgi:hypothetical protein
MDSIRKKLDSVLDKLGYADVIDGQTNEEVLALIESKFISLDDIDINTPYELMKYEIKEIFWEKHWVDISLIIDDDNMKRLYELLCDWKKNQKLIISCHKLNT